MENKTVFIDNQYQTNKLFKIAYWVLFVLFIFISSCALFFIISSVITNDMEDYFIAVPLFLVLDLVTLIVMFSLKNRKLIISTKDIKRFNLFGKCIVYEYTPKNLIIHVMFTHSMNRGIKLKFLISGKKIFSYDLVESLKSTKNLLEQRFYWGVSLKQLGCEIIDKNNYLHLNLREKKKSS